MANVTIDIDVLTKSLKAATRNSLPWTSLDYTNYTLDEPTRPPINIHEVPQVMLTPAFVPSAEYFWNYADTRQVILEYIIQRDTSWRTGKLRIFHNMDLDSLQSFDETIIGSDRIDEPQPFKPHSLYVNNIIDLEIGDCGVIISAAHDSSTSRSEERFGITFQITGVLPAIFPKIAAAYISIIPSS